LSFATTCPILHATLESHRSGRSTADSRTAQKSNRQAKMPVTTRRRAAAIAANLNRRVLKPQTPSKSQSQTSIVLRNSQTPPAPINTKSRHKPTTQSPTRSKHGVLHRHARRKRSLPTTNDSPTQACRFGHRLYDGEAFLSGAATVSPKLRDLLDEGVEHQARFWERKLAQISADLAATGERELWEVHHVVDVALGILRGIGRG
jgi:hypothetical protein